MSTLPKAYEPSTVEPRWYERWKASGAFRAEAARGREEGKPPHAIVIPPPNVTGVLHMGHILNNTLQDIFTRRARLEGKEALWLPGTDHAGIATQTRVERKLREETGQHRRDLGREQFLGKVWEWKEEHGGIILDQLEKLGASCDWERTAFTLDEGYSRAVLTAFVSLYEQGFIYRGKRMVNWCPVSLTALSDEEVIMKPQQGKLWTMRYELSAEAKAAAEAAGQPRTHLEIATTRPETIMGDTAVAVHPEDERYKHLIGKTVYRPFPRAEIPIVADAAIDREFGTGCLKVTPAHDRVDFEIGQRHGLPVIDVFHPDGRLNDHAGEDFAGMDRFEARKKAAQKLDELGLLVKTEDYENSVGFSERADVPIEPRLSDQWWLKYPRVEESKRAVQQGLIQFYPKRWEKTFFHWLDNIQDWCISRQLWWGHRIPAWYRKGADRSDLKPADIHVSVDGPPDPENWEQEEDVLDTWASSWLWPFATMGWPDEEKMREEGLDYFYPTSTLVTGFDIIFFWVARMVMAGLAFRAGKPLAEPLTDEDIARARPFEHVYFTGLIRDGQGRKMSKSLGNSPDPLELIAKYGADGLRFGIVNIAPKGQDILFNEERISLGRNLCNKLWNACRFRQMSGEPGDNSSREAILARIEPAHLDDFDHWMLDSLLCAMERIAECFAVYDVPPMSDTLYHLFWTDFCDTYVEVSKSKMAGPAAGTCLAVQDLVLREILLLLHPFCPFITEELWHLMGYAASEDDLIQNTRIETSDTLRATLAEGGAEVSRTAGEAIGQLLELVSKARALKAEYNLASKRDVTLFTLASEPNAALLASHAEALRKLIGAGELKPVAQAPQGAPGSVVALGTVYLDLASAIDVEAEKERLSKELAKLEKLVAAGEGKLKNPKFVDNAPANVVEGARQQLAATVAKRDEVQRLLGALGA